MTYKQFHATKRIDSEKMRKNNLVVSFQEAIPQKTLKHMVSLRSLRPSSKHSGDILLFVIKIAALEAVRRFSKSRCPILWRFFQAFQVFGYPPFKWIQRWAPLRLMVRGAQSISRPMLLLSISTAFSKDSEICRITGDRDDKSQPLLESLCQSSTPDSLQSEESSKDIVPDSFQEIFPEPSQDVIPENWLQHVFTELKKQDISLPERYNEDELLRFFNASNGDLPCLVTSLKKTIRWRESYKILSSHELEAWSNLVFWHGFDKMMRPCLVVRLGLACSTLAPHDRPCFAQAVVSQIDHGVLRLTEKNSQITVLIDCHGLSPFKFPMNMMRSCSILVQDHYPNRLGLLLLLRLPPAVRVLTQIVFQVLRPATLEKLQIVGEKNQKFLFEVLKTLPSFLGSNCECSWCRKISVSHSSSEGEQSADSDTNNVTSTDLPFSGSCDHVLRATIIVILMFWVFIAMASTIHNLDSLSPF